MKLQDIMRGFANLYDEANVWRFAVPCLTHHIMKRTAALLEYCRKSELDLDQIADCSADAMAWTISLCNLLGQDLDRLLAAKFPGVCIYCASKPCSCQPDRKGPPHRDLHFQEVLTLDEWQTLLDEIYGRADRHDDPHYLASKATEEANEIDSVSAGGLDKKHEMVDEIVDLVSWLLALANRLGFRLEERLLKRYKDFKCPSCKRTRCDCTSVEIARVR